MLKFAASTVVITTNCLHPLTFYPRVWHRKEGMLHCCSVRFGPAGCVPKVVLCLPFVNSLQQKHLTHCCDNKRVSPLHNTGMGVCATMWRRMVVVACVHDGFAAHWCVFL